jgi:hypothetical protein
MPRSTHGAPLPPDCVWDKGRTPPMIKHKFLKQVEGYPTPLMAKNAKAMWNMLLERGHATLEAYAAAVSPRQSHSPARPRPAFQQPSPQGVLALTADDTADDDNAADPYAADPYASDDAGAPHAIVPSGTLVDAEDHPAPPPAPLPAPPPAPPPADDDAGDNLNQRNDIAAPPLALPQPELVEPRPAPANKWRSVKQCLKVLALLNVLALASILGGMCTGNLAPALTLSSPTLNSTWTPPWPNTSALSSVFSTVASPFTSRFTSSSSSSSSSSEPPEGFVPKEAFDALKASHEAVLAAQKMSLIVFHKPKGDEAPPSAGRGWWTTLSSIATLATAAGVGWFLKHWVWFYRPYEAAAPAADEAIEREDGFVVLH